MMGTTNSLNSAPTMRDNSGSRSKSGRTAVGNGTVVYLNNHHKILTLYRDRGAQVTLEQKEKSLEELEVYRRWFQENIMKPDANGGSDAVLFVPCGSGEPKYRDLPNA